MTKDNSIREVFRDFVAQCQLLNGCEVHERAPWNTVVTPDAIRHYAYGISDDNPLWLDADYARASPQGHLIAPPTFLCSVLYPVLHGAPISVPFSSLIVEISFKWYHPVNAGDTLRATARQLDAIESHDLKGQPLVLILSEVEYWNQYDVLLAKAKATLARALQQGSELRLKREIYRYNDIELRDIGKAQQHEIRSGKHSPALKEIVVGDALPTLVRGPLTIGDMICWQAAIGPSYRAGSLGYQDTLKTPHSTVTNPVTGWPVKYSQQHEDFLLSSQRGMPAPFDNGVMRLAWVSPLLTNWIGDDGSLQQLTVRLNAANLYGDTTWYHGTVANIFTEDGYCRCNIDITGINQLGETTTTGEAVVMFQLSNRGRNIKREEFPRRQKMLR